MIAFAMLIFAVMTFFVSFLIGRDERPRQGKVAAFTTLIAWGSLMYGLFLAKNIHECAALPAGSSDEIGRDGTFPIVGSLS